MSRTDDLISAYRKQLALPWASNLAASERVWLAVYPPEDERRVALRYEQFAQATRDAGFAWSLHDISSTFADWMGNHEYRAGYFEAPDYLSSAVGEYETHLASVVRDWLESADSNTVVALSGLSSLFGITSVSNLIANVESQINGRLLGFFPGHYQESTFRLLDARDGWNYRAIPIVAS